MNEFELLLDQPRTTENFRRRYMESNLDRETMSFGSAIDNALPETKRIISKLSSFREVPATKYIIGDSNLVSFGFYGCRALILSTQDKLILGHLTPHEERERYFNHLLEDMNLEPYNFTGIVIGGIWPEKVANYAEMIGMKIRGCYQDIDLELYPKETQKDVIVKNSRKIYVITRGKIRTLSLDNPTNPFLGLEALK